MHSNRTKKGFTLMELLIVVAIIAVLVAIAIPVLNGNLAKAKEAACKANRRSLYAQVVIEHMLSGRPCSKVFDEFVVDAGKCPCEGVFSWEDDVDTGIINCDYHDGSGSGSGSGGSSEGGSGSGSGSDSEIGSGSTPVLHGTANITSETFTRGAVIQDDTGTCVIMSGMWATWLAYSDGAKAAALAEQFGTDAVPVDASDIKDSSFTGTLETGDLYYDSASDTYYYVTLVSLYESRPNSSWIPLLK